MIHRNQLGEQLEQQRQNKLTNSFSLSVCETKNTLGALNTPGGGKVKIIWKVFFFNFTGID